VDGRGVGGGPTLMCLCGRRIRSSGLGPDPASAEVPEVTYLIDGQADAVFEDELVVSCADLCPSEVEADRPASTAVPRSRSSRPRGAVRLSGCSTRPGALQGRTAPGGHERSSVPWHRPPDGAGMSQTVANPLNRAHIRAAGRPADGERGHSGGDLTAVERARKVL
jgi:hypothetical protein